MLQPMLGALLFMALSPLSGPTDIEFKGADGFTLRATLTTPAASGKRPAALILAGSGPTDRDGNQPPALISNILLGVSNALVESGYVTLRLDKRSCAVYRNAWPTEPEALAKYYSYDMLLSDAKAAYKQLAERPEVDAKRLMIVGHSAGGLEAVMLAAELQPEKMVMLAALGRPMREVLPGQYQRALAKANLSESVRADVMASLQECIRSVGDEGKVPEKVHSILTPLVNDRTKYLLRSYLNEDPTEYARKFKGDVLVLNGEFDVQVDPEKDATRLFRAFADRLTGKSRLEILSRLSHNFKEVASIDEPGVVGLLSSALTRELAKFVDGKQE